MKADGRLHGACSLVLFVACIGFLASSRAAHAYPVFQLSTGASRCSSCHVSPSGGGLLNAHGRAESADTISGGGNGDFLHGLVHTPKWLQLGGDFRFATLLQETGGTEGTRLLAFPMQADLHTALRVGDFSLHFTVGLRGSARGQATAPLDRFVSREHYLMWRRKETGLYIRAGKYFPIFGLRLAEHVVYVRRYLGLNMLEEPYALSAGWLQNRWELHATAFVADFLRPVGEQGSGGALYLERRLGEDEQAAIAGQVKVASGPETTQTTAGLVGKLFVERARLMLMAESDLVWQHFPGALPDRGQWALYGGAHFFLRQGLLLGASYERFDQDLSLRHMARDAFMVQAQWFPTAHVELALYGRVQTIGGGAGGAPAELLLFQFHYWL